METSEGRILIADDEEVFCLATADLLRKEGLTCECAHDAATAAALLDQHEYDLLIADIRMPGNEDLEFVSSHPQLRSGLPVIIVTAFPTVRTAVDSVRLAVTDYLVKPFEFHNLLSRAKSAIVHHRTLRAARHIGESLEKWQSQVKAIENGLVQDSRTDTVIALDALTRLAHGHLQDTLTHIRQAGNRPNPPEPVELEICKLIGCHRLNGFIHAIKDTVAVLEQTKTAFKSKELRDLRMNLEQILVSYASGEAK